MIYVCVCVCKNTRYIQQAIGTVLPAEASVGFHEISCSGVGKNYPTHRSVLEIVQWVSVAAVSRRHAHTTLPWLSECRRPDDNAKLYHYYLTKVPAAALLYNMHNYCGGDPLFFGVHTEDTHVYNAHFTVINVINYIDPVVVDVGTNGK